MPRSATNLACYGELGRTPLMIKRKLPLIKYWLRITTGWNAPELVEDALVKSESHEWANFIQKILNRILAWVPTSVEPTFYGGPKGIYITIGATPY